MTYHYLKDLHWCKGDRFYYIGVGCITSKPYKGCCLNLCLSHIDLALGSGLVCDEIEVTMSEEKNRKTKVMIIEDEEDILVLFRDYLSSRGHHVVCCCRSANHVVTDFEKSEPDICLIDYILGGKSNGIDAAIEILKKSPSMPVIFVTAYESMTPELHKHPTLEGKNIQVLMKPVRMHKLEDSILNILNKNDNYY